MRTTTVILTLVASLALPTFADDLPARPEKIDFAALRFEPPKPGEYRHVLSNGVPVYLMPSKEFPLVNIAMTFKGGDNLDPADIVGLADATGAMMRRGGTTTMKPEQFDERVDFLAAIINASSGESTSSASLNCLSSNLDESMKLFIDMLRNPGFDAKKLEVWKGEAIEGMKQRNDDAGPILDREWKALLYGRDHFEAREMTKASLDRITPAEMAKMHDRIFNPGNVIVAVTGDFETSDMLNRLEKALGTPSGWAKGEPVADPAAPTATFKPGVYHVEKDIPQGKVFIGLRGVKRDDPDYFPLLLLNDILGGGGFTSRITKRVRSDEGLAYSAGSRFSPEVWYPGEWRAVFQSKNPTVALATKIIMEEIDRVRAQPVTDEELQTSIAQYIETFPRTFESKAGTLNVFANDEWTKRPADYWQTYRDRIKGVTKADVERVAQKYLDPKNMAIFVVGKWDEIYNGDMEGRAKMSEFFGGEVQHLPLRDPLTQEPLSPQAAGAK
ncbi:MAG: insulinase family protein [Phycisphaerales bacterium]